MTYEEICDDHENWLEDENEFIKDDLKNRLNILGGK